MLTNKKVFKAMILLLFLVSVTIWTTATTYAENETLRVVDGLVEKVSADSIKVDGQYYNLVGATIRNNSEEIVSMGSIKRDKKVQVFLKNDRVSSVIIFEDFVE